MLFQKSFAALLACLAGVAFANPVDLSRYRWAVVGDSISDPLHPQPNNAVVKYYHFLSRDTGIQVVYTNAVVWASQQQVQRGVDRSEVP